VVPLSKRELVMRLVHEELGHNTTNTAAEIAKVFHWPSLRRDVGRVCHVLGTTAWM
jgi:hypothetical protein